MWKRRFGIGVSNVADGGGGGQGNLESRSTTPGRILEKTPSPCVHVHQATADACRNTLVM